MDDLKLAEDLKRMLDRFRQAGAAIAAGADCAAVLAPFGALDLDHALLRRSRAASADLDSASVESIFLALDEASDTVNVLQMHFKEGITVGALQAELGDWRRVPPEPEEAAYTSAYFDPGLIAPGASFQFSALVEEWCDCFTPQTLVNSLHIAPSAEPADADRPG